LRSQCQRDRDDGRQALRNGRHSQAHGCHEHHACLLATPEAHSKDDGHDGEGSLGQHLAELIHPPLEGRALLRHFLQKVGDLAQLGGHACPGYDGYTATVDRNRTHEHHILAISDSRGCIGKAGRRLLDGHRLPRQCGLLHSQVG